MCWEGRGCGGLLNAYSNDSIYFVPLAYVLTGFSLSEVLGDFK